MFEYLFVHTVVSRTFPVRFWVRERDQALGDAPPELEALDGWVAEAYADDLLAGLRQRFVEPGYVVERMSGTSWQAVEDNFAGLYFH